MHEILLFRIMLCNIVLFFGATYAITFFIDSFFLCQTYAVTLLELRLFETGNNIFQEIIQLIVVLFAAELVIFVVVCLSFFWCSCLEASLCTEIFITFKHVFKRYLTCCTQLFNCFFPILFNHVPPIFFESESICSGAPTSLRLTIIDDVKDVLGHNLNAMGGICKKGRLWDFLIKFPFRCLKNLTSDTNALMLEHSSQ